MADDSIPKLSSEIRKDLGVNSSSQLVQNTTTWGGIQHLDPAMSDYQRDLFLNHLISMPPLLPVADLTPAPTQQTEYLLQPSLLNLAHSSDMAKNESLMLQIDNNKKLSHKTEGISQPSFVASVADSMGIDRKRKGKEHHGETEEVKYKGTSRGEGERVSPSVRKSRDKHNLSEKKRRNKISENFKNLQNHLAPFKNKSDQVSILDAAIAHIKLLKQQEEMLSMVNGQGQFCIMPSLNNQLAPRAIDKGQTRR
ncbi:transcription factor LRL2-like [Apium graveolens]|uniref:transcription factor LRL2-like n=1 Tax=Apium graveolens TaxID=4045 RepID=UPI003D79DFA7